VFSITSANVNIEYINEFFGPRMNNNGWKYDDRLDPKITKNFVEIYYRVIGKEKGHEQIINNHIC
jgi:hypothetical protein